MPQKLYKLLVMFLIKLNQTNKAKETVFSAQAKLNLLEGQEFEHFGKELATFCKDVVKLQASNKAKGLNSVMIRKTLPVSLELISLDESDDIDVSLRFGNFGKFVENTSEENISALLAENAEFVYKYSNWTR